VVSIISHQHSRLHVIAFQSHAGCVILGTANNAGAILVVGRGLVVVPKLIHPIPPPLQSPETSPERGMDETWMQVSPYAVSFFSILYLTINEVDLLDAILIFWCSFAYCRSSIFRGHQLLLGVDHSLTLIVAH